MFVLRVKIESYQAQENKMRKKVKTMSEKFMETKHEVQKEVVRVVQSNFIVFFLVIMQSDGLCYE